MLSTPILIAAAVCIVAVICVTLYFLGYLTPAAGTPAAGTPDAGTPAANFTSSTFPDQLNMTNTDFKRTSQFAKPLLAGQYSKVNISFTIADQNDGNANAVGAVVIRDKTTQDVMIVSTKKSFPATDRPSKSHSVDLTGTYILTGNEEVYVVGGELYGGYSLSITNGSVTFSN